MYGVTMTTHKHTSGTRIFYQILWRHCYFEITVTFMSLALFMPLLGFVNLFLVDVGCNSIVTAKQCCFCFVDIHCFRCWPACLKNARKQQSWPLELESLQSVLMRTSLHLFVNRNRMANHFLSTILKLMDWFVVVHVTFLTADVCI